MARKTSAHLVPHRFPVQVRRWLHRQEADDLKEVVLHHVPDAPGLVVELPAALDAEALGHRDLHALHVVPVPDRLEEGIGEPEEEEVLHRLLPQVVVDPEDRGLGEHLVEHAVQLLRAPQIAPEGLLHHHPGSGGTARLAQRLDDRGEQGRRNGQVVGRGTRSVEHRLQLHEGLRVAVVPIHVAQLRHQPGERRLANSRAVRLHALPRTRLQLLERPPGLGHPDHRTVEVAVLDHRLERGKDLLVGQISGRSEEHQRVRAARPRTLPERVPGAHAAAGRISRRARRTAVRRPPPSSPTTSPGPCPCVGGHRARHAGATTSPSPFRSPRAAPRRRSRGT